MTLWIQFHAVGVGTWINFTRLPQEHYILGISILRIGMPCMVVIKSFAKATIFCFTVTYTLLRDYIHSEPYIYSMHPSLGALEDSLLRKDKHSWCKYSHFQFSKTHVLCHTQSQKQFSACFLYMHNNYMVCDLIQAHRSIKEQTDPCMWQPIIRCWCLICMHICQKKIVILAKHLATIQLHDYPLLCKFYECSTGKIHAVSKPYIKNWRLD